MQDDMNDTIYTSFIMNQSDGDHEDVESVCSEILIPQTDLLKICSTKLSKDQVTDPQIITCNDRGRILTSTDDLRNESKFLSTKLDEVSYYGFTDSFPTSMTQNPDSFSKCDTEYVSDHNDRQLNCVRVAMQCAINDSAETKNNDSQAVKKPNNSKTNNNILTTKGTYMDDDKLVITDKQNVDDSSQIATESDSHKSSVIIAQICDGRSDGMIAGRHHNPGVIQLLNETGGKEGHVLGNNHFEHKTCIKVHHASDKLDMLQPESRPIFCNGLQNQQDFQVSRWLSANDAKPTQNSQLRKETSNSNIFSYKKDARKGIINQYSKSSNPAGVDKKRKKRAAVGCQFFAGIENKVQPMKRVSQESTYGKKLHLKGTVLHHLQKNQCVPANGGDLPCGFWNDDWKRLDLPKSLTDSINDW